MKKLLVSLGLLLVSYSSIACPIDDTLFNGPILGTDHRFELCDMGSRVRLVMKDDDGKIEVMEYASSSEVYKMAEQENEEEEMEGYYFITYNKINNSKRRHVLAIITKDNIDYPFYQLYIDESDKASLHIDLGLSFISTPKYTRFKEYR